MMMMKVFTAAMGSSLVSQGLLKAVDSPAFEATRRKDRVEYGRYLLGMIILGAGTTVAGMGPSMFPAGVVAVNGGEYVCYGAFAGALAYSLFEKFGVTASCPKATPEQAKDMFWDTKYNLDYTKTSLITGVALIGASFGLEKVWPHSKDLAFLNIKYAPLLPTVAGLVLGFNQFPLRKFYAMANGASTTWMNFVNLLTGGSLAEKNKYVDLKGMSQFFYIYVAGPLAVYLAAKYVTPNELPIRSREAFSPLRSFAGGFLSLLGSRIANGCLCGGSISGTADLNVQALLGAAVVFGSAMATSLFF